MKIEILYPEICHLYGDLQNIKYIAKSNNIKIVETHLDDKPAFIDDDIALVYMGTLPESGQLLARDALKPYLKDFKKRIKDNKLILFTGNSFELLGEYIEEDNGNKIKMLNIYPFHAVRKMDNRYNSLWLGQFENMKLVGFKSQFTQMYGDNSNSYLFKTLRGDGLNLETKYEGFKDHNFMATYVIGPLLVLNPEFSLYLLKEMGVKKPKLLYQDLAMDSYLQRLKDYEDPKRNYRYS